MKTTGRLWIFQRNEKHVKLFKGKFEAKYSL